MPITTTDLVTLARQTVDDVIEPFLLNTEQIIVALDRAQREFVDRTLCLQLHNTPIPLTADEPLSHVEADILRVRGLTLNNHSLQPVTLREMHQGMLMRDYGVRMISAWDNLRGEPRYAITDAQEQSLRWVPIPIQDDVAYLDAYIYPPLMSEGEDPAIPQRWCTDLVIGAVRHLYWMRNSKVFDPKAAEVWDQKWHLVLAEAYAGTQRSQRGAQTAQFARQGVW